MTTAVESKEKIKSVLVAEIPYLRRYARALSRNTADADDLVQTCLVRAIVNLDRFETGTNLRAWLLTILHNVFIDTVRRARRARDAGETAEAMLSGLYTRPNQIEHLQMADLQAAMASLPAEQRSTLALVALEDLTYEEAAVITGVPVGTVRSRLSRARHALMKMIEGTNVADLAAQPAALRRRLAKAAGASLAVSLLPQVGAKGDTSSQGLVA